MKIILEKLLYLYHFSGINILAELVLNQVRLFMNALICSTTMK